MLRHRRTDPACTQHRAPRTRLQQRRYDRARGLSCPVCTSTAFQQHGDDMLADLWRHPTTDVVILGEHMPSELTPLH